jgi:glutaminase
MLRVPNISTSVIRRAFDSSAIISNRLRSPRETEILQREGAAIRILELQGELIFSSMEKVVREVHQSPPATQAVILNFRHVLTISENCIGLLVRLWQSWDAAGREMVLAEADHLPRIAKAFRSHLSPGETSRLRISNELDAAMEAAENELLDKFGREKAETLNLTAREFMLCRDFTAEEISQVEKVLTHRSHRAGETVLRTGEPSTELHFLKRGKVSVMVESSDGQRHRVATYSPGMAFGEVAFLDRSPRSALVQADTDIECAVLHADDFDSLTQTRSPLAIKLLRNIAIEFSHTVRRSNNALRLYSR